jgi:hypothetical protein
VGVRVGTLRPAALPLLVLLIGWTLFAFAHFYRATMLPLACGIAALAVLEPPAIGRRGTRLLDAALLLSLAGIALQLVPLGALARSRIAPAAQAYDRAMRFDVAGAATRPVSIDATATWLALAVAAALVLLFWCLRTMFARGGLRAMIRSVAWISLIVTPLAIVQHVMPLPIVDRAWGVTARGLRPYGPFVNRNDFAGWLIMAAPLTAGYALARLRPRQPHDERFAPPAAIDSTSIWLGLAVSLAAAGLLFSQSRSGLFGMAAGLALFTLLSRGRTTARETMWTLAAFAVVVVIAATYADVQALSTRLHDSLGEGLDSRLSIWRQTWPVVRDFWPVGSGAGTYEAVMVRYQTMSRFYYISHADNEGLQILAEGGLLLGAPAALTLTSGAWLVAVRLRADRTAIFWVRAGAAAGLLALVAQNMVEMTLRVPANGVMFALLAAVATHETPVER